MALVAEPFELTDAESRVIGIAVVVVLILALATTALGNTTSEWRPAFGLIVGTVVWIVAMIAWLARTRGQGWYATARKINRRVFRGDGDV
jgi:hypothetical protein